jgi:hypothetical protein
MPVERPEEVKRQKEPFRERRARLKRAVHALTSSASNEAYTPPVILEAGRNALGGVIDLDPASCAVANEEVKARRFYTQEDNGLFKPWSNLDGSPATVWLNPPGGYLERATMLPTNRGMSSCVGWWWALCDNFERGLVKAACFYVFRLDTLQAMRCDPDGPLPPQAHPFCLFDDRPRHWNQSTPAEHRGRKGSPTHACAVFYLGPHPKLFAESFEHLGHVRL